MSESTNQIDIQEFINELSQDPWCKLHVERVLLKLTNKALASEIETLKEKIGELDNEPKVVSK